MKRATFILMAGLLVGAAGYACLYFVGTSSRREMLRSAEPELLWLKKEFQLSDTELARISRLHEGYLPHCAEMCGRIEMKNAELKELLAKTNTLTAQIESKLAEASQLRLECQKMMLQHFYEVSRTMQPDQGKRYLAWVQAKTFLPNHGMTSADDLGRTHEHATDR